MQILAAMVTRAKSHHRWSRVWEWERRWVSRVKELGNAKPGDGGDEGKEPGF
jgi:hypothetical protein